MSSARLRHLPTRFSPVVRDSALAVGLFAALLIDAGVNPDGKGITAWGVVTGLVATAPITARSRWPIATAIVLLAATVPVLATLKPVDVVAFPVFFALYTVAATGDRRRSLVAAVGVTLGVLGIVAAFTDPGDRLGIAAQNVGIPLTALALGDAVRWRTAYRAAVARQMSQAVSDERLRIARDLHDSIAHAMTAINVQSGSATHLLARRPEAAQAALIEIRRISGEALRDLRSTLGQLRQGEDAPMRPTPSLAGLDDLAERVRAAGVAVHLTCVGAETVDHIPAGVDAAAHRIVQEALTNVLRHSRATAVSVTVTVTNSKILLAILDSGDGKILSHRPNGAGFGLLGMHERATSVGGSITAQARPEGGWEVRADLPLAPR